MSAAPITIAGGRNQTSRRGCRIVTQNAVMTANARSIGREQTSSAAVNPATKNREREGDSGHSRSMSNVNISAAGPCCQRLWLAVHHKFEPRAAASAASHASRPRPSFRSTARSASAASVVIAAAERLAIVSNHCGSLVSQPGWAQSSRSICGIVNGSATNTGPIG